MDSALLRCGGYSPLILAERGLFSFGKRREGDLEITAVIAPARPYLGNEIYLFGDGIFASGETNE